MPSLKTTALIYLAFSTDLSYLVTEGVLVRGLGEAGGGVDVDIHLLGQLQQGDVIVEGALMALEASLEA